MAEVRNSAHCDIVDQINPVRQATNLYRGCKNMTTDYGTGIWIGRAGVGDGKCFISCSLNPGVSAEHWAIMINGTIYEVVGKDTETRMKVASKRNTSGLQWTLLDGNNCPKSNQQLD